MQGKEVIVDRKVNSAGFLVSTVWYSTLHPTKRVTKEDPDRFTQRRGLTMTIHLHLERASLKFVGLYLVLFEFLTAVCTKMAVLWVIAPCRLV
jgi:hypothetical protein